MISLRSIALGAVAALTFSTAQAAYIVDTGAGSFPSWSLYDLRPNGTTFQSLAATFTVGTASTITSVEGWIGGDEGNVLVQLIAGGNPNGSLLFSASFGATSTNAWQGASGLNWDVAAGDYTLAFYASTGFAGVMQGEAPNPLATEWFMNENTGGVWAQYDDLNIGVRIDAAGSAVPEPGTAAMVVLGFAALGFAARRRRA